MKDPNRAKTVSSKYRTVLLVNVNVLVPTKVAPKTRHNHHIGSPFTLQKTNNVTKYYNKLKSVYDETISKDQKTKGLQLTEYSVLSNVTVFIFFSNVN